MIVYIDSSALLKRIVEEVESDVLESMLEQHVGLGDVIVASTLARVEVSRGLLRQSQLTGEDIGDADDAAMSGVSERSITPDVVRVARRISPFQSRTLDAIHLATALLLDADIVLTYDQRLASACQYNGLKTASPGL